jgi:hypothetical protein
MHSSTSKTLKYGVQSFDTDSGQGFTVVHFVLNDVDVGLFIADPHLQRFTQSMLEISDALRFKKEIKQSILLQREAPK